MFKWLSKPQNLLTSDAFILLTHILTAALHGLVVIDTAHRSPHMCTHNIFLSRLQDLKMYKEDLVFKSLSSLTTKK